jgi:hypothetical protein
MSDTQKNSVLTTRLELMKGWVALLRECGKKVRRAPNVVFDSEQLPYLRYSPVLDGVFCAPCHTFNSAVNVLVARPLTKWCRQRKRVLDSHKNSKEHFNALTKANRFVKINRKEEQNVAEFGSTAYRNKVERNRQTFTAIIEVIIICGRQT